MPIRFSSYFAAAFVAGPLFLACSCRQEAPPVAQPPNAVEVLNREIAKGNTVVFASWDGALRGRDNDQLIHLSAESAVVLEDRSISVTEYSGTYSLSPSGLMTLSLKGYPRGDWPAMILREEEGTLRLYREDGVTVWAPEYPKEMDGYWPFRAKTRSADH